MALEKEVTNYGSYCTSLKVAAFKKRLTHEERKIIKMLERSYERELTEQEMHLSLEQARAIGEL
jgi:hypothetical protein